MDSQHVLQLTQSAHAHTERLIQEIAVRVDEVLYAHIATEADARVLFNTVEARLVSALSYELTRRVRRIITERFRSNESVLWEKDSPEEA